MSRRNGPRLLIPANAHVWVHSSYIDATNKTVKPKKLNVRTGPGENYSIVGVIEHGTAVKEISTKGNWMEIEAPAAAFAFCRGDVFAASRRRPPRCRRWFPLRRRSRTAATTTVAPPPGHCHHDHGRDRDEPRAEPAPVPVPDAANAGAPPAVIEEVAVAAYRGARRRRARHGEHSGADEIWTLQPRKQQADQLSLLATPRLDLSRYYDSHVIVTGEEGLDERWKNTPSHHSAHSGDSRPPQSPFLRGNQLRTKANKSCCCCTN